MTTSAAPEASRQRGTFCLQRQQWQEALTVFDRVLLESPADPDVLNDRATALEGLGRLEDALTSIDQCLAVAPRHVSALRNRAMMLVKLEKREQALAMLGELLAVCPNHLEGWIQSAYLLHRLDRREEALTAAERAVASAPSDCNALNTRGMIFDSLGRTDEARADYERALTIDPRFADAINNIGILHSREGRFLNALACFERSLALAPNQRHTLYNRSTALLSLGEWQRGFREFESRWQIFPHEASRRQRLAPVWTGQCEISGKTILIHHEQGYGDTLQFCRYVPLVARLGATVILAVPKALKRLMSTLSGCTAVVAEGEPIPRHDYCCSLMSLPMVFGTTVDDVPAQIPYLRADQPGIEKWQHRLGRALRPRIGLVWTGRRYPPINYPRDMRLEQLRPVLDVDAEFISLQQDLSASERELLDGAGRVSCLGGELQDFAHTAALIATLDLVITVDTAIAHLAGALGKPVWVMNRYASCWRWLQKRSDSPWYPTLRLFRQRSLGEWGPVVHEIRDTAEEFIRYRKDSLFATRGVDVQNRQHRQPVWLSQLNDALSKHRKGRWTAAIEGYQRVLAHDHEQPDALHYLGVCQAQAGEYEAAVLSLSRAVELQPQNAVVHNHHGNALVGLSRCRQALDSYENAIRLDPSFADAHYNRGVALERLERRDAALASYDRAIACDASCAKAHNNRGNVLVDLRQYAEALRAYQRATQVQPGFADAWINCANAQRRLGHYEEALDSCAHALRLERDRAEAHSSRGAILSAMGRFAEALESCERALELQPALAEAQWNKSILKLSEGELNEGWTLYETRWRVKSLGLTRQYSSQPPWLGSTSVRGKVVLLHAEQGYGDTIQFCRYAPLVAALGAKVILSVPASLQSLIATLAHVDEVLPQDTRPRFDEHCPLLSLPLAMGTDSLEQIPAPMAYLSAEPSTRARWSARLGPRTRPRIGLVWAGKETHSNDANRSLALAEMLPLLEYSAQYVSLQKQVRPIDAELLNGLPEVARLGEELTDFADAAALVAELDLIISVDTAIAHLAGALGKPVWVLLPYVADWRWLQERRNCPWYPTATLFRQPKVGDWLTVIEAVRRELSQTHQPQIFCGLADKVDAPALTQVVSGHWKDAALAR